MSYDDASFERGSDVSSASDASSSGDGVVGTIRAVTHRLQRHFEEWPQRYVEQQARLYESEN